MLCAEAVLQLLTTTWPGPRMAKLAQQHSRQLTCLAVEQRMDVQVLRAQCCALRRSCSC